MTKIAFLPLAYGYEVCPPLARWRADELSVIEKHPTLLQGVDVVCIFYLWCIFHNHVCKKATAASKILVHCQASSKYNPVNDSQNIFYLKTFKNGIDFTKRQFSKKLTCKKLIFPMVHILPCSRILPHF